MASSVRAASEKYFVSRYEATPNLSSPIRRAESEGAISPGIPDTLILFTDANKDNLRGTYAATSQILSLYLYLIRRNQGHAAPQDNLRAKEICGYRRYTSPGTFALESSDGTRIGDEEGWFLPYE